MPKKAKIELSSVTEDALREELTRTRQHGRFWRLLASTLGFLLVIAAIAVLVAVSIFPVLRIHGSSMYPTLQNGQFVVAIKNNEYQTGDIVAFYYNNSILVKRVIASQGEWVQISEDGTVYKNGELLEEPYVKEKALGECDIELPYQVPDSKIFVMGDYRSVSVDSRSTAVGCIPEELMVGRLLFVIWPLSDFGPLKNG